MDSAYKVHIVRVIRSVPCEVSYGFVNCRLQHPGPSLKRTTKMGFLEHSSGTTVVEGCRAQSVGTCGPSS